MMPANKHDALTKALQHAFAVDGYENIQQLTKGLSGSFVFKMTVQNTPYLLRIIGPDARDNPNYYFGCMQTAAADGLAPKIHYLSVEDGLSITDYLEGKPFYVAD